MNKTKICEALYALPGEVVVKRRKPLAIPAVVLLAGAAMIVLNNLYGAALSVDLRSALVFTGAVAALAGMVMVAVRLAGGDGAPFHSDGRCYLRCEELRFGRDARRQVEECIASGDVVRLLALPRSEVPALAVALYRTPDNRFAAMRAFEYAELEYRPLTGLRIVGA
ncbi:hypothetical protein [uncultured Alistipes sp.]|uniref:hypothetical protein n=1 Tax=uncultured Alistipes sp. TaxID=538949 RepID=UPI0026236F63|nr:hypothetical protein [uncultured Alistipes sp.]